MAPQARDTAADGNDYGTGSVPSHPTDFHNTAECDAASLDIDSLVDTSKVIEVEKIDFDKLPPRRVYHVIKRLFDVVSCSLALIVLAVPMLIIAILIKLDSPGPVFYKQERLGFNGKPIVVVKFRSMRWDAEDTGVQWADKNDPRVTRVGRVLRITRLDEVPQFLDVVKGDLSLIGPRPERAVFYKEFEQYIHGFSQRLRVKPGISGLAQVMGGYNLRPAEKIVYDIEYIKNQSLSLDAKIVWQTIKVVITGEGAR